MLSLSSTKLFDTWEIDFARLKDGLNAGKILGRGSAGAVYKVELPLYSKYEAVLVHDEDLEDGEGFEGVVPVSTPQSATVAVKWFQELGPLGVSEFCKEARLLG